MSAIFDHYPWTVQALVTGVESQQIRLPDLQRPFVWANTKVRDLIDSMYKGYPVGELMFWENTADDHTKGVGAGSSGKPQGASFQIVDGQQRLTSLYAVIKGLEIWREGYSRETIRIAFNPNTERFEVPGIATRSVEWIQDIVEVFKGDTYILTNEYVQRLKDDGREVPAEKSSALATAFRKLNDLLEYKFEVIQLKQNITREEVADIFVRINSEGMNLTSADFILTWMSVFWEEGRTELETFARDSRFPVAALNQILQTKKTWSPHNPYLAVSPGQMLRVSVAYGLHRGRLSDAYNALRGRDPRTREIIPAEREKELAKLQAGQVHVLKEINWDEFLKVIERAGFRSSSMITSANTVLYSYAIWLMGRVDFGVPVDRLREVMARWFFMSQITGRYTNSPETKIQEDISRLDTLASKGAESFVSELNDMISAAVPADWWRVTLVDNLRTSSTTAPAYVAYIAALNILQAEVLLSTTRVREWIDPHRTTKKGIERHHLFPKDYLKSELKLTATKQVNQVANFALLEWWDNIAISNEAPSSYWPDQLQKKAINDSRRLKQEQWHALPTGWFEMSYEDFLSARRELMAQVTLEGFKFLADPNYEPNLERGDFEVAATPESLRTLEDLVTEGVIQVGTLLELANDENPVTAEVLADGSISMGERIFTSPGAAARELGIDTGDGWDLWLVNLGGQSLSLAEIRLSRS
jgi:hypothetical protein